MCPLGRGKFILISQGWSMEQVKKHLGHSTIRVTSDRYGHLFEGHDKALLEGLDATYRDVGSTIVATPLPEATVTRLPTASQGAE